MATTEAEPVTRADCDRCGARASVHVTLRSGAELTLCGHHGREHEAAMRECGAHIETTPRSG